jgi:hypothetical protein
LVSIAYWRGGHRSANILAHRGPPAPINWRSDVKNVKKNVKKKRTGQFGAPRLFSSQSPIN